MRLDQKTGAKKPYRTVCRGGGTDCVPVCMSKHENGKPIVSGFP